MSHPNSFARFIPEIDRTETPRAERPAVSYLVRFWLEPREQEGEDAPYRGYVRDLETGEERYFSDPRRFAEHLLRQLRAASHEQTPDRETNEIEGVSRRRASGATAG